MIKLVNILKEIQVGRPSIRINYDGDDTTIIVNGKEYKWSHVQLDFDDDEPKHVNIIFNEPSFGGGAPEEEIQDAYDVFDLEVTEAMKVLKPYASETDDHSITIKYDKIENFNKLYQSWLRSN